MDNKATRRAVLGALAIPAVIAAGGVAAAAATQSAATSEWHALKAKFDAARARADAQNDKHDSAWRAYDSELGPKPDLTYQEGNLIYDLWRDTSQLYKPGNQFPPQHIKDEMRARLEAYEARKAHLNSKYDLSRLGDEADALEDTASDLSSELIKLPAPDAPALLWKLEYLFGADAGQDYCQSWSMSLIRPVVADVRRLLSHGRA